MTCPDLTCPDLTCPDLTCPDLTCPDLTCPDLTCPDLSYYLDSTSEQKSQNLNKTVAGYFECSNLLFMF